ncbi:uncharacterized protein LOC118268142 [Spodoptera frugiperda]|uniref:Uncharacterized protein LOC118268142 n=1 Tax=Spodoptera frugiperda TaxID=7108 RepID=A0A9R0F7A2_SPOFR|nr:uncharacterized protein LOC118268142 [Spodoptera frugiperda]
MLKMFINKMLFFSAIIVATIICHVSCNTEERSKEALAITLDTTIAFYAMFAGCISSSMPSMKFARDDLKSFVNYPSKTTVGFAPKFTSNRKFFANMISTPEFRNTLAKDEEELRQDLIRKMKFCDSVVMDQDLLQALYDREVDQSKM